MTQWVGEAWESIHKELQPTIQHSFRKCGIIVAIDGSEDDQINIRGLNNYQIPRNVGRKTTLILMLNTPTLTPMAPTPLRPLILIQWPVLSR